MWNEHFGIGIVEMMSSGLLTVAHNSGGPRSDIIAPGKTGFLATTPEEYADALAQAMEMPQDEAEKMRERAAESSKRFSDDMFAAHFSRILVEQKLA